MKIFQIILMSVAPISMSVSAQEGTTARTECASTGAHVEMRACLQTKADESARELRKIEDKMRKSLGTSDQEPEFIKRSISRFDSAIGQFRRYREQQCEFIASLASGGNGQGDLQLSCIYELNEKRIAEIQQANAFVHK